MVAVLVVEGDAGDEQIGPGLGEVLGRERSLPALIVTGLNADADLAESNFQDIGLVAGAVHQVLVKLQHLVVEGAGVHAHPGDVLAPGPASGEDVARRLDAVAGVAVADPFVSELVGGDHPLAVGVGGLVEIAVEGEGLRPDLLTLGIDEFEHVLLVGARLRHPQPSLFCGPNRPAPSPRTG